jgi:hypothetical protein
MAAAMRALATAVLSRTAEQPSSRAWVASEAVPMPASRITGTEERRQTSSMASGLAMPRPEPMGEPSGITAAAPASASFKHVTRSSLQYGKTTKPLFTSSVVPITSCSTSG